MADVAEGEFVGLLAPIPNGQVLAALCQLNRLPCRTLENSAGTIAVFDDTSRETGEKAGKAISAHARGLQVVVLDRRDGQLTVDLYKGGAKTKSLAPGLALSDAPGVVLSLASGGQSLDEVAATHPEKVFEGRGGRWAAFRALQRLGKQAREEQRNRQ